jgi:cation diffusion facilitator CzcD-associated flavoprotein CzcO
MLASRAVADQAATDTTATFDAIIIGAGISGMYQLYRLHERGMRVTDFEAGTDVGGTWYWNRYPGARFDSESWTYGYCFSEERPRERNWKEHFAARPDTPRDLNRVADRFDPRRDIQCSSRVAAAHYDEATGYWAVTLENGERFRTRFLFTALGPLSADTMPNIPGVDSFQGPAYHTARWPHEAASLEGKRVGIIGTGATAIQASDTEYEFDMMIYASGFDGFAGAYDRINIRAARRTPGPTAHAPSSVRGPRDFPTCSC